ncbi:MAG: hypothetical protein ACOCX1_04015, partial [Fimbriimonadaceae bacterium]
MKRFGWIFAGAVTLASATLAVAHAVYEPVFPEGSQAGPVAVGGLTKQQAAQALNEWWAEASAKQVDLDTQFLTEELEAATIAELGLLLDVEATLDQASRLTLWQKAGRVVQPPEEQLDPLPAILVLDEAKTAELNRFVERAAPEPQPASFALVDGKVQITPERAQVRLDEPALKRLLVRAIEDDGGAELPLEEFGKTMPDEMLAQMS